MKETLLAGYDIKFSQATTVLSEMTSEGRQRLFYYKAFIHSFDYILFSQCLLCSCFFFSAMFMAGEGKRSSICSKNEIITMNKYCFHKRRYSLYILKYSLAREAIEAAIVHVFKT